MSDFLQFARSYGIHVKSDFEPGRWYRTTTDAHPRKRNGAYKLSEDGRAGWIQDWALHSEPILWRASGAEKPVYVDQREIESRRRQREEEAHCAARDAKNFYAKCQPLRHSHPYLEKKTLEMHGCEGLKVDLHGNLVVPMFIEGQLASVQRISPDGAKLFWLGGQTKGAYYVIGRNMATITIFAEGLATGLTIFSAIDECRVIVGFNAGNLPAVVFKPRFGISIVAADNDWETAQRINKNPGIEAAEKAASIIHAPVAIPTVGEGHSDFNDMFQECLEKRQTNRMFSRWKCSDAKIRQQALSDIKLSILTATTSRAKAQQI